MVAYCGPPITSREDALPPGQTRHRGSLIIDLEAIDNLEITQICQICQIQKKRSDCLKGLGFPHSQKSGQYCRESDIG